MLPRARARLLASSASIVTLITVVFAGHKF